MPADFGDEAGEALNRQLKELGDDFLRWLRRAMLGGARHLATKAVRSPAEKRERQASYGAEVAAGIKAEAEGARAADNGVVTVTYDVETTPDGASFEEMAKSVEGHMRDRLRELGREEAAGFSANEEQRQVVVSFHEEDRDAVLEAVDYAAARLERDAEEARALTAQIEGLEAAKIAPEDMRKTVDLSGLNLDDDQVRSACEAAREHLSGTEFEGLAAFSPDGKDGIRVNLFSDDAARVRLALSEIARAPLSDPAARAALERVAEAWNQGGEPMDVELSFLGDGFSRTEHVTVQAPTAALGAAKACEIHERLLAKGVAVDDFGVTERGVRFAFTDPDALAAARSAFSQVEKDAVRTAARKEPSPGRAKARSLANPLERARIAEADIAAQVVPPPPGAVSHRWTPKPQTPSLGQKR